MRLTRFSDYAVRVLLYLGVHTERLSSIGEIARVYGISENHLMKVVSNLAADGYVETVRGRNGGIRLGRPATQINIGQLIRYTEGELDLMGCAECTLKGVCSLPGPLDLALAAFFSVLEAYTLADVLGERGGARLLEKLALMSSLDLALVEDKQKTSHGE